MTRPQEFAARLLALAEEFDKPEFEQMEGPDPDEGCIQGAFGVVYILLAAMNTSPESVLNLLATAALVAEAEGLHPGNVRP